MRKLCLLILVLLLSLGLLPITYAQQPNNTPLILLKGGDLWSWTPGGELKQLTTWGYNGVPAKSPLGDLIAYKSWAQEVVAAMNGGQFAFAGEPANNIWLMNLITGEVERIAAQPDNFSLPGDNNEGNFLVRSDPVWSYDGRYLAWIEHVSPDFRWQLVLYNVAERTSQVIVSDLPLGYMDGGLYIPPVSFGNGMIAYGYGSYNGTVMEQWLNVYNLGGSLVSSTKIGDSQGVFAMDHVWVNLNEGSQIALLYDYGSIAIFDPLTGTRELTSGTLTMVNPFAQPSATLEIAIRPGDGQFTEIEWLAAIPGGGQPSPLDYYFYPQLDQISISPDGNSIAYIIDTLYIWQGGQITQVPGTNRLDETVSGLAWGYDAWTFTPDSSANNSCTLLPRLQIGRAATVLPAAEPNAIRAEPRMGDDNATLGAIPVANVFHVMDGPICADGYLWWQVNYAGITGWTAEGGEDYWLAPLACNNLPVSRLTPNSMAQVIQNTAPNVLRDAPGTGSASREIGQIPPGVPFRVLGEFACGNDGRGWWKVEYEGITGWTAEGEGSTYWLEPLAG